MQYSSSRLRRHSTPSATLGAARGRHFTGRWRRCGRKAVIRRGEGRGEAEIQLLSPSWAGAPARRTDVVIGMMNGLAPTPMPHRPSRPPAGDPRSNRNYLTIHWRTTHGARPAGRWAQILRPLYAVVHAGGAAGFCTRQASLPRPRWLAVERRNADGRSHGDVTVTYRNNVCIGLTRCLYNPSYWDAPTALYFQFAFVYCPYPPELSEIIASVCLSVCLSQHDN